MTKDMTPQERFFYGAGKRDAMKLTEEEWETKREEVARSLSPTDWRLRDNGPFAVDHPAATTVVRQSLEDADTAMTALGFTR